MNLILYFGCTAPKLHQWEIAFLLAIPCFLTVSQCPSWTMPPCPLALSTALLCKGMPGKSKEEGILIPTSLVHGERVLYPIYYYLINCISLFIFNICKCRI